MNQLLTIKIYDMDNDKEIVIHNVKNVSTDEIPNYGYGIVVKTYDIYYNYTIYPIRRYSLLEVKVGE